MLTLIANLGYFLMLCAFITRDLLSLRSLLLAAQALIVVYAWATGLRVIVAWNTLFFCINAVMIWQIFRERRRVELPEELRLLYEQHFAAMTPQEFLRLWTHGREERLDSRPLIREGSRPDSLYYLLDGVAHVSREGQPVTILSPGAFIGEMSLLTGEAANADVDAVGVVRVRRWSRDELLAIAGRTPLLWTRIQSVLGRDIVEKIRNSEVRRAI
ncbi:MAG: cyclic nucleotide-binding domain-containing protein [Vicinamibacterales bacterium]